MNPPPAPGTPEFLNNVMPQVSPAMLNYGVDATSQLLQKQRDLYMPGVSNFWNSLKIYFMVNNSYVVSKLKLLLFPFQNKVWQRVSVDESYASVGQVFPLPTSYHTNSTP
jgi:protein transport protein YIF1